MGRTRRVAAHSPGAGAHLALVRSALGLTGAELYRRTGVSAEAFARLEDGRTGPDEAEKATIARALGIPLTVLWGPSTEVLAAWLERPGATARGLYASVAPTGVPKAAVAALTPASSCDPTADGGMPPEGEPDVGTRGGRPAGAGASSDRTSHGSTRGPPPT